MHPLATVPLLPAMAFLAWLRWNGRRTGEVWEQDGAGDRFTRELDMHSFAH